MKTLLHQILFLFLFSCFFSANSQEKKACTHSILVQFKNAPQAVLDEHKNLIFTDIKINTFHASIGVTSIRRIAPIALTKNPPLVYNFGNKEIVPAALIQLLLDTGYYKYAEPNFIGEAGGSCSKTPNDNRYSEQWGLKNTGNFDSESISGADINMEKAWGITTGSTDIVVAVLDTGLYMDHPDLASRIWKNNKEIANNGKDDDGNGYIDDTEGWDFVNYDSDPSDDFGHGTNVTGIIAANGNNGDGYAGVDWNCKIMPLKVLDENNNGFYSNWITAIYYAVDNGADVINMSLGGAGYSNQMEAAIDYANQNNVIVVACMMNTDNDTTYYPAAFDTTIAIGAIDTDYTRASPFTWSATSGSCYGPHINLVAPGNKINGLDYKSDDFYPQWSGTSQATPYVTGVVSLLKGMKKNITLNNVREILQTTSRDQLGNPQEDTKGWDQYHGYGLLDAYGAILKASETYKIAIPNCSGNTTSEVKKEAIVVVKARGRSGGEVIQIKSDNTIIKTVTLQNSFKNYNVEASGTISVAFINDQNAFDVVIDYITINDEIYQAEDQAKNSGVYQNGSCGGSYSEKLHCKGEIVFETKSKAPEPPKPTPVVGKSRKIVIRAKGNSNTETIAIKVGTTVIETVPLIKKVINHSVNTELVGTVSVAYINADTGSGVSVYYATIAGKKYLSKFQPSNTGVFQNGNCGGSYSAEMTCNGAITFETTSKPVLETPIVALGGGDLQSNSLNSETNTSITSFPNPTRGLLTIAGLPTDKETSIQIFDNKGVVLLEQKSISRTSKILDLSSFKSDIYFAKVTIGKIVKNSRIIIAH